MALTTFRTSLAAIGRWLEGSSATRSLDATLLLEHPLQMAEADVPDSGAASAVNGYDRVQPHRRLDRAAIARVFDSAHPVRTRKELFGRARELDALLSATLDFGQHAIIHGARGSGKTSLVRVYGDHADQQGALVIYMACEPGASFADLVHPYLRALPTAALASEERASFREGLAQLPAQFGPRMFVELLAERVVSPVVFIFDEFDRITDGAVKAEIAAAMKLLSDSLASVMFVLVGIARDVGDVISGHPSLRRHMRAVQLGRIEPQEVEALVEAGEAAAGLVFDDEARQIIARASCGSPFHVRLFCHHAAVATMIRGSRAVLGEDARSGLRSAIEQWSAMNPEDAGLFVKLIEHEPLPLLERIAYTAALEDRLPGGVGRESEVLGSAVIAEGENLSSRVFRDSVAPQLLIAYAILAESASASSGRARKGTTDVATQ